MARRRPPAHVMPIQTSIQYGGIQGLEFMQVPLVTFIRYIINEIFWIAEIWFFVHAIFFRSIFLGCIFFSGMSAPAFPLVLRHVENLVHRYRASAARAQSSG